MDRLTSDWFASTFSASAETLGKLSTMRGRSRELERNDPYMENFLSDVEDNVIGPDGMALQMKISERIGGKDVLDDAANRLIENHWYRWNQPENFTVTGDADGAAAMRRAVRSTARDGECIIRFVRGYENSAYGFALQFIEADQLDENYSIALPNGAKIDQGVELDKWGRMVALHILAKHPGDIDGGYNQVYRERIPASDCVLVKHPKRFGETRSAPWFAPVGKMLRMLHGYQEAEVVAARAGAAKMAFVVSDPSAGTVPEYTGEAVDANDPKAGKYMDAAAGTIEQLPPGLKVETFDPQHPTAQYNAFCKGVLRAIASGLHVSYNHLANDLEGVNYSSLREGKLWEREAWTKLQAWWISTVMRRVFAEWLKWCLATGKITFENGSALPMSKFDKFNEPQFRGRRWPWVDPVKDMQAMEIARNNGWTSDSDIIESQGGDIEDVYGQIQSDTDLAKKYGVEKMVDNKQQESQNVEADEKDGTAKESDA